MGTTRDKPHLLLSMYGAAGWITQAVLALVLAAAASLPARADVGGLVTGETSVSLNRDPASGKNGLSYDPNVAIAFFNLGFSLRSWDGSITGWNGRRISNEAAAYAGVGLFNLFEVQRGISNAGARTRYMAMISLSDNFPLPSDHKKPGLFGRGVILTPFMETSGGKKIFGLGLVIDLKM